MRQKIDLGFHKVMILSSTQMWTKTLKKLMLELGTFSIAHACSCNFCSPPLLWPATGTQADENVDEGSLNKATKGSFLQAIADINMPKNKVWFFHPLLVENLKWMAYQPALYIGTLNDKKVYFVFSSSQAYGELILVFILRFNIMEIKPLHHHLIFAV